MVPSRVLITGASSLLGKYLIKRQPVESTVFGTYYCNSGSKQEFQLDVTNSKQVKYVFMLAKPDVVIHLAAIGAVDMCEHNPQMAAEVNIGGTIEVAEQCRLYNTKMVLLSTNAVFDGTKPPYVEGDTRNPLSVYGNTKAEAEDIVSRLDNHLIVRTERMFGKGWTVGRDNWVDIVVNKLLAGKELNVVTDDINRPTFAGHLATVIWWMLSKDLSGIYHAAGDDVMNLYNFACMIARIYNENYPDVLNLSLLKPCSKADKFGDLAPRPLDTTFDLSKLYALGMNVGGCYDGLKSMVHCGDL